MTVAPLARPLIYVTRDIERALGMPLATPGYFIISNSTPFAKRIAAKHPNVFLIDAGAPLDTHDLLERDATREIIARIPGAEILVFKNTTFIERVCEDHGWTLLNPPAQLANTIEEKVTQLTLLSEIRHLFLPYQIVTGDELLFSGEPVVVQFNHSHTGNGTILVKNALALKPIREQFPNRTMRVTPFVDGPIFTSNIVVGDNTILPGNVSFQITGLAPFTRNRFATIGNDWALPHTLLSQSEMAAYDQIARAVGEALQRRGWRGLFGIDVIMNMKTRELSLIEINARQPASTSFESILQARRRGQSTDRLTTFTAHLAALRHLDLSRTSLIPIVNGAQVILRERRRHIADNDALRIAKALERARHVVVTYPASEPEADRLRIQSIHALMKSPTTFGPVGQKIIQSINRILL